MKDETIYKLWTEFINDEKYKKYFLSQYDTFINNLNELKLYIDTHNQRPSQHNKDKTIKSMGKWIGTCQNNYTKKDRNMKDETIRKLWEDFINNEKYKKYFLSQYDSFVFNLNELKTYIDNHNKRPPESSKDKTIKSMGIWIGNYQKNYTKKDRNMKDETIYKLWTEFINDKKYKKYIQLPTMLELFNNNLNELKLYIDTHNERPSQSSKNKTIKNIASWIGTCQTNYTKKLQNMKDETIYKLWTEFINDEKYKKYFLSQYDTFINNLNELKLYIDTHNQRPSQHNKDKTIKSMGKWIGTCQNNYTKKDRNMKDETIRKLWEDFINNEKYKKYFLSQYDSFVFNLNELKLYIDTHNKRPSKESKDKTIKRLGQWISACQRNYTKKKERMADENIRKLWEDFINNEKYKKHFNKSS